LLLRRSSAFYLINEDSHRAVIYKLVFVWNNEKFPTGFYGAVAIFNCCDRRRKVGQGKC